ncbi:MAG: 2-hydroxyacyl-CoA dehydratase [Chloroflexi bacterium]|nr:2-hydroxyacyl-CoA dehydratase [Chloroflexota bacterium]
MVEKQSYQGRIHLLQKEFIAQYFKQLDRVARGEDETKTAAIMISGNVVELLRAFDVIPLYPEINALQLAVKKVVLPYILKAEEMGYSVDNCAYVKADIGLLFSGNETPLGKIPIPSLILCNYVGCNVYLNWFEHLAEYTGAPIYNLDLPFVRDPWNGLRRDDVKYVVAQLKELIALLEKITGKKYDEDRLKGILALAAETEEHWSQIKHMTKHKPAPYDAFFDAVMMMAPLYCLRGTMEGLTFFQEAYKEMDERVRLGIGALPEERFRFVIEGPTPWPHLRTFRDLFTKWGAVAVASTYSTVGGMWEFGFRHDPARPLESIAEHMLIHNYTNRNLLQRREQMQRYVQDWSADALILHSVKSCRVFSAGQGDLRELFARELDVPTLLIESDIEDPRYFAEAQLRNRIDAFFESLEHKKLVRTS